MDTEAEQVILPREEEAKQTFRFEQWLIFNQFNRYTVIDYFKFSQFYDRSCNNEILSMQGLDPSQLVTLQGLEYIVVCEGLEHEAPYYLIYKQRRYSETESDLLAVYYVAGIDIPADSMQGRPEPVLKGTIIPMPDLNAVLTFNMKASVYFLHRTVESLQSCIEFETKLPQSTSQDLVIKSDVAATDLTSLACLPVDNDLAGQFMHTFHFFDELILKPTINALTQQHTQSTSGPQNSGMGTDADATTRGGTERLNPS